MNIDNTISSVHSILQMAVGRGKPMQGREIESTYKDLEGKNLADILRTFNFNSTEQFLLQFPNKFQRVGQNQWYGTVTDESSGVIDDMMASKNNGRKGAPMRGARFGGGGGGGGFRQVGRGNRQVGRGNRQGVGGGGHAIPRVHGHGSGGADFNPYSQNHSRGRLDNFARSQKSFNHPQPPPPPQTGLNPSSSSRFNAPDSRDQFDNYRQRPRERTQSPPHYSYPSSNNYDRNDYDRDDDRRRPYYDDDRNGGFGQYQADPPTSRPKSVFGRQDYDDRTYRDRSRERVFDNSSRFQSDDDDDDLYDGRGLNRSRSSRSMFGQEPGLQERARSKSRSMRDVRVSRSDEDSLAARFGELPMTNDRANDLLFKSGVDNEPIEFEPVAPQPRNTKQNVAAAIVEIFEGNNLKSLKVVELIKLLNQRGMDLPIGKYGDVGSLKRIKDAKQRTLRFMRINEIEKVVHYGEERAMFEPTSSNQASGSSSTTRRTDAELQKRGTSSIIEQLKLIVGTSMSMRTAIERIKFDTHNDEEKIRQVALAILTQEVPVVFNLDRLDDKGTITRKKHEEVTPQGEIVISDRITSPQKFHAKLVHPWSKPTEFAKVPATFPIEVVKFDQFGNHFYVRCLDQNEQFEKMQRNIQIIAEKFVKTSQTQLRSGDWRKNDGCLVLCQVSNDEQSVREWHRAVFDKVDEEDDLLVVNLIDVGQKKSATVENVIPMPTSISTVDPFAIKCCLLTFNIIDDESFEEIEQHWKEEFETRRNAMDLNAETIRCDTPQEGLVIRLMNRNKAGRYFDVLQSLANDEFIEIVDK